MYLCHEHDNGHQIFIMTGRFLLKYSQGLTIVAVFRQKLQKIQLNMICVTINSSQ